MTHTSAIMLLILGIIFLLIAFSGNPEPKYIHQEEYDYDDYDDEEEYDDEYEKVQDITESEVIEKTDDEETYVSGLIKELKSKTDKTQKDKDKISLLEIKLKQLKNKR